ncbi:MAG: hypothetical protein CVU28_00020 [Betaproteobacteria bacterium HGW-Betaproteobacteria-21]|nr:MAG: hypothetical protein CVU28_00020 [Betaproteobacteria bacterium HGW-Betaproteobacteria-21]
MKSTDPIDTINTSNDDVPRKRRGPVRRKPQPMALEARLMFDGAAVATAAAAEPLPDAQQHDASVEAASSTPAAVEAFVVDEQITASEIVFVDSGVTNWQQLIGGMRENVQVVVLESGRDGLSQIAEVVSSLTELSAIHIISHGSEGSLQLAGSSYTASNIEASRANLETIGNALSADGDILLYGCDIGAGSAGEALLSSMSEISRADIAASNNDSGSTDLGGDWLLETETGTIETSALFVAETDYSGVLALPGAHVASNSSGLFLGGNYIELGIRTNNNIGKFGADTAPGGTFTGRNGQSGIGMVGDADGFGSGAALNIDYFMPGSPEEGFYAGYNGGTVGKNFATSVTNTSSGDTLSALVTGTLGGTLKVEQAISFQVNDKYFKNVVTLTNLSGSSISQVRFMRSFDPDNTVDRGGSYSTTQTIERSMDSGDSMSVVSAVASSDSYATTAGSTAKILYYTSDARAKVSFGTGGLAPSGIYDSRVYSSAPGKGSTITTDAYMSIAVDVGTLAAGQSTTFTYYTSLDNRDISTIVNEIAAADNKTFQPINEDAGNHAGQTVSSVFGSAVAITSIDNSHGTWQYSSNGTSWSNIGSVSTSNALLLSTGYSVRFVPSTDWSGGSSLSYKVWNGSGYSAGASVDTSSTAYFSANAANATIAINAVNDAPVLGGASATLDYDEGQGARTIDSSITVTDADSPTSFSGGWLEVRTTANGESADQLVVQNQGMTSGLIGIAGSNIYYGGVIIGSRDTSNTGANGSALRINLNSNASQAAVQALARAIGYYSTSTDPSESNRTVTFKLNDGGNTGSGGAKEGSKTATIAVTAYDPTEIGLDRTTASYIENDSSFFVDPQLTLTQGTDTVLSGARVVVGSGFNAAEDQLSGTNMHGIVFTYDASKGVLTASGLATVAQYQEALRSVRYANTSDNPDVTARTITFTLGNVVTLTTADGKNHYYETVSGSYTWTQAKALAETMTFQGLTGYLATITSQAENDFIREKLNSDAWIGASDDYAYINAATGALTFTNQTNAEGKWYWVTGPEAGTLISTGNSSPVTPSGGYANWNTGEPNNANGENYGEIYSTGSTPGRWNDLPNSVSLAFVVEYSDNGGTSVFSKSVTVTPQRVNDAPVTSGTVNIASITEDAINNSGALVSSFLTATDPDNVPASGIALTSLSSGNGVWEYSTNNGATWIAVGSVSDSAALLLRTSDRVRFVPDGNNAESVSITYRAWDMTDGGTQGTKRAVTTNGGNTAYSTDTQQANLTVTAVNDAPVLTATAPALTGLTEDDTSGSGQTVASVVGTSISDIDAGATEGLAITALSSGNGTWQFDTGSGWTDVGTVSASSALLLRATDLIRFVPNGENATAASFTYKAWDTTSGSAGTKASTASSGGSSAFSTASDTASISVSAVNDAPVLTGPLTLDPIDEDDTNNGGQTVGSFLGANLSDVDSGAAGGIAITGASVLGSGKWQYDSGSGWTDLPSVANDSALLLRATDKVRYVPDSYQGGSATLTLRGWDTTSGSAGSAVDTTSNGGSTAFSSATTTASINVREINDAPTIGRAADGTAFAEASSGTPATSSVAATIGSNIEINDDGGNLSRAVITLSSGFTPGDVLAVASPGSLTAVYDASTGVLTLSGTASVADYQAALRSVTFRSTSEDPTVRSSTRSIGWAVYDADNRSNESGTNDSSTITLTATQDAPTTAGIPGTWDYTEDDGTRVLAPGLTLADVDDTHLSGASVTLSGLENLLHNDQAGSTPITIDTSTWPANPTDGTATLNTAATLSDMGFNLEYLKSAVGLNAADASINAIDATTGTISWNAGVSVVGYAFTDGGKTLTLTTITAGLVSDSEYRAIFNAITGIAQTAGNATDTIDYTVGTGSSQTTLDLSVKEYLGIRGMGAVAADGSWTASDILGTGIAATYSNGVLSLSGNASVAAYQQVLRTVTYTNAQDYTTSATTSPTVGSRNIAWQITDADSDGAGAANSAIATTAISLVNANEAPQVIDANVTRDYTEGTPLVLFADGLTASDDSQIIQSAAVSITTGLSTGDTLAVSDSVTPDGNGYSHAVSGNTITLNWASNDADVTESTPGDDSTPEVQTLTNVPMPAAGQVFTLSVGSTTLTTDALTGTPDRTALATALNAKATAAAAGFSVASSGNDLIVTWDNPGAVTDVVRLGSVTSITADYVAGTGRLTLTGAAAELGYQSILRNVTFDTTSDDPTAAADTRKVQWRAFDSDGVPSAVTTGSITTVRITAVNDAPQVTTDSGAYTFIEGGPSIVANPGIVLGDPDDTNATGATVAISGTGFDAAKEYLGFAGITLASGAITANSDWTASALFGTAISASFDAATGTLTLSGRDSIANYEAVLRQVTYANASDHPTESATTRTLTWTLTDDFGSRLTDNPSANDADTDKETGSNTSTITLSPRNDAPTVADTAGTASYTEGGTAAILASGITLDDVDDANIDMAKVWISGGFTAGDTLGATLGTTDIGASYDAATGILTLSKSGGAPISDFQTVLRSVTFSSTADAPTATSATRTIAWQITDSDAAGDGALASNIGTSTVELTAVDNAASISDLPANGSITFTENGSPTVVAPGLTIADPDDTALAGATVTLNDHQTGDTLNVSAALAGTGISVTAYDPGTGILSLTGTASIADYQRVLRSITFASTSENPTAGGSTRSISWTTTSAAASLASDANTGNDATPGTASSALNSQVVVTGLNDAGTLGFSNNTALDLNTTVFQQGGTPVYVIGSADGSTLGSVTYTDPDDTHISSASVVISENRLSTDTLSVLRPSGWGGSGNTFTFGGETITAAYDVSTGTLTFSGSAGVSSYNTLLAHVQYQNGSTAPTSSGASRELTWTLTDANATGDGAQQVVQRSYLTIRDLNDAPQITGVANVAYTEGALSVDLPNITVTDPDPDEIITATLTLSNPSVGVLSKPAGTAYTVATGVWTITGTVAEVNTALAAVSFIPTMDNDVSATIAVDIADGGEDAAPRATGTIQLNVTAVNDASVLTPGNPVLAPITEDDTNHAGFLISSFRGASTDVDTGTRFGIAITELAVGNGHWEYALDDGSGGFGDWIATGTVSESAALLLRDSDKIRFVPDEKNGTNAALTYRTWDRSAGSAGNYANASDNGNATPFSTATDVASLLVTSVNDAPHNIVAPFLDVSNSQREDDSLRHLGEIMGDTGEWGDVDIGAITPLYRFQWQVADDASGTNVADIPGATNLSYVISPDYVGKFIRLRVYATDGITEGPADSNFVSITNTDPVATMPLPAQQTMESVPITFTIPETAFADPEVARGEDTFTFTAELADGSPLPTWLTFDPTTLTFSGTPSGANVGDISITVWASDGGNFPASITFTLRVIALPVNPAAPIPVPDPGRSPDTAGAVFLSPVDPALGTYAAGDSGAPTSAPTSDNSSPASGGFGLSFTTSGSGARIIPESDAGIDSGFGRGFSDTAGRFNSESSNQFSGVLTSAGDGAFRIVVTASDQPALMLFRGIPDLQVQATSGLFEMQIPADAFTHTNPQAVITLRALQANEAPLPAWITFDPVTGKFSGMPPNGFDDELVIKVIARDADGREAVTTFRIKFDRNALQGKQGLSEQLRLASRFAGAERERAASDALRAIVAQRAA